MKKYVFLLLTLIVSEKITAQQHEWANGAVSGYFGNGNSLAVDAHGSVYTTGQFWDSLDFDPGPGTAMLYDFASFTGDVYIAKYDSAGNYLWAKSIGGYAHDLPADIAVDGDGNCYVIGQYALTVDFDPGPDSAMRTSTGNTGQLNVFIVKLDTDGNYQWVNTFGGTGVHTGAGGITMDGAGHVIVTGSFDGPIDFDPGPATANLASGSQWNTYIAKYDTSGNYVWAKALYGTGSNTGRDIACDSAGSIYVTGEFDNTVDFNPGSGTYNLTASAQDDIYLAKYSPAGTFTWASRMGSSQNELGISIAVDDSLNVLITGYFTGTVDFNPGPGSATLTSNPSPARDVFFAKYNTNGIYRWARKLSGTTNHQQGGRSIDVDDFGNVFLTAHFENNIDADPSPAVVLLQASTNDANLIGKYDRDGKYLWAKLFEPGGAQSIYAGHDGNFYFCGAVIDTVDFDFNAGVALLIPSMYVAKYNSCEATIAKTDVLCFGDSSGTAALTLSGANAFSINWSNGDTLASISDFTAGTYYFTATSENGCFLTDSISIGEPASLAVSFSSQVVCTSSDGAATATVNGGTMPYTYSWSSGGNGPTENNLSAGSYVLTITDNNACVLLDSITILQPPALATSNFVTHNNCFGNTNGSATVNISGGASPYTYQWSSGGNGPTENNLAAGTYTCVVTDSNTCTLSVPILINQPPQLDTSVMVNGALLSANLDSATYQWVDCGNGNAAIPGATNQSYAATQTGNYAVAVSLNGCTDTSDCHYLNFAGINELFGVHNNIFPNPFLNVLNVNIASRSTLVLYNSLGQEVGSWVLAKGINELDVAYLPHGIYLAKIDNGSTMLQGKLVK
jgi:hypothetical protein